MYNMLYVVGTPIGNLSDVSKRVAKTLEQVDLILCEDTRVTRKLCNKFEIDTPLESFHHHSSEKEIQKIIKELLAGKEIALVTDGGTPGIADPAGKLIAEMKKFNLQASPVPGPSALIAAASVSGFYMNKFTFLGFPPKKRKRNKFFEEALSYEHPVIFYEAPYRILKTLQELNQQQSNLEIVVCRELTKIHEKIYRGSIKEVIDKLSQEVHLKGEFTVIIKSSHER